MYGSSYTTCRSCLVNTYKTEGIRAFYRSFPTQFIMNVPFQTVHFVVYELTQEYVNPTRTYMPLSHIISGATAGGAAAFITNPLDVCRTLLNTQESTQNTTVRGLRQAVVMVYRTDGLRTFFRGVTARMFYQMPSTAISWSVYEAFKHLLKNKHSARGDPPDTTYTSFTPVSWTPAPACSGPILTPPNK